LLNNKSDLSGTAQLFVVYFFTYTADASDAAAAVAAIAAAAIAAAAAAAVVAAVAAAVTVAVAAAVTAAAADIAAAVAAKLEVCTTSWPLGPPSQHFFLFVSMNRLNRK
jgi:hypothetical protein